MENKIRRRTILVDDEELAQFYRDRLGPVHDARTLKAMIRRKGSDVFLRMTEEDIRRRFPSEELERYPDQVRLGGARFSLTYRFDPGSGHDGVTLNIPRHLLREAATESPDLKIPGLLREKILALLKGLPKEYRRQLIPLGETLETVMDALGERKSSENLSLLQILSTVLQERMGISIPASAWSLDSVPDHLAVRYALVGKKRGELKASRNISDLLATDGGEGTDNDLDMARRTLERGPLAVWDMGDLPAWTEVSLDRKRSIRVCQALSEDEGNVFVRIFRSGEEARERHAGGVRRLWELGYARDRKYLEQCLVLPEGLRKRIPWEGGAGAFETMLARLTAALLVDGSVRNREEFTRMAAEVRPRIYETSRSVRESVEPVLSLYTDTRRTLADMKEASSTNSGMIDFIQSLSDHLDRLVPPDFPSRYDRERLARITVYIRGIALRAERGVSHLEKDRTKEAAITPFTKALERLESNLPSFSSKQKYRALDELAWMIEEFRLSLFAPELKTAGPVSPKRLDKKIAEIESLI